MFPPEPVRGDPCTPVMASAGHRAAGLTLLPIISPGQYMAIRTIVWLHSRILHCVGLIKLSRGKAYSNTSGHMWASASTPNSASSLAREKNRGHCTFSSNVKRSMAARPNRCHTRRTIWGWIFHSPYRGFPLNSKSTPMISIPGTYVAQFIFSEAGFPDHCSDWSVISSDVVSLVLPQPVTTDAFLYLTNNSLQRLSILYYNILKSVKSKATCCAGDLKEKTIGNYIKGNYRKKTFKNMTKKYYIFCFATVVRA